MKNRKSLGEEKAREVSQYVSPLLELQLTIWLRIVTRREISNFLTRARLLSSPEACGFCFHRQKQRRHRGWFINKYYRDLYLILSPRICFPYIYFLLLLLLYSLDIIYPFQGSDYGLLELVTRAPARLMLISPGIILDKNNDNENNNDDNSEDCRRYTRSYMEILRVRGALMDCDPFSRKVEQGSNDLLL